MEGKTQTIYKDNIVPSTDPSKNKITPSTYPSEIKVVTSIDTSSIQNEKREYKVVKINVGDKIKWYRIGEKTWTLWYLRNLWKISMESNWEIVQDKLW